jgi:hypothetical protein
MGNHEYYGHTLPDIRENYRNQIAKVPDTVLLERDSYIVDGVRFLGTTLWSDLSNPIHAINVQNGLNDFRKITIGRQAEYTRGVVFGRLKAKEYTEEHIACRDWLKQEIKTSFDGPTVVVTHHSPSPITCSPYYKYSKIRNGFHSDMTDFVIDDGPKLWIYGHDHVTANHKLGQTKLVSNQPGYPQEYRSEAMVKIEEVDQCV